MVACDVCGKDVFLPYRCRYCGKTFCSDHRLPENHSCEKITEGKLDEQVWDYGSVYTDRESEPPSRPMKVRYDIKLFDQRRRSSRSRNHFPFGVSIFILIVISLVFIAQMIAEWIFGPAYFIPGSYDTFLYYLAPSRATIIERPWTIITSIFAHGGFFHIFINGIVFLSFGPLLEARIGRKKFLYLFFGAGIFGGIAQLMFTPPQVVLLGASGAILGVLGTMTVLNPRAPVLLLFIPVRLWMATLAFGILSAVMAFAVPGGYIAHMAHFAGLTVGLIFGYKLRVDERRSRRYQRRSSLRPWFERRG